MPKTLPVAHGPTLTSLLRVVAASCLIGVLIISLPTLAGAETAKTGEAQHAKPAATRHATAAKPAAAAKATTAAKPAAQRPGVIRLEKRLAALRDQLGITVKQRPAWRKLATVMRENEVAMYSAETRRSGRIRNAGGLENLRLYGLVAAVHAANIQRMMDAFQPLYDSFSPIQKKIADKLLRDPHEVAFSDGF
jgi:periplasmic protein CpxP/Spy